MNFKLGERVKMTAKAIEMGLDGRQKRRVGKVTRIKSFWKPHLIGVLRDGMKRSEQWYEEFWEKEA